MESLDHRTFGVRDLGVLVVIPEERRLLVQSELAADQFLASPGEQVFRIRAFVVFARTRNDVVLRDRPFVDFVAHPLGIHLLPSSLVACLHVPEARITGQGLVPVPGPALTLGSLGNELEEALLGSRPTLRFRPSKILGIDKTPRVFARAFVPANKRIRRRRPADLAGVLWDLRAWHRRAI